jgi:hypothetical protein
MAVFDTATFYFGFWSWGLSRSASRECANSPRPAWNVFWGRSTCYFAYLARFKNQSS